MTEPLHISPKDRQDKLWLKVKAHLTHRLASLREQNDNRMPESDRNLLIGRIAEVKQLLDLETDSPDVTPPPDLDGQ